MYECAVIDSQLFLPLSQGPIHTISLRARDYAHACYPINCSYVTNFMLSIYHFNPLKMLI